MDDQAYLEPDFDPSTLTVPRLRSILVAHNINYPSSAKKGQLIDYFNDHVKPQASKLRAASLRVKRTSRGIVDVASQSTDTMDEDDDLPPPPSTSRSARRTTSRARTEEPQEVAPTPRSTRHSTAPPETITPRRVSSKHGRTIPRDELEEEPEIKRPVSRKRMSAATPKAKAETEDDDSPFSSENVFQAGSSPPIPSRDTDRRRTTLGAVRDPERRQSSATRRKTEEFGPLVSKRTSAVAPVRKTFEMPVSAMKRPRQEVVPSEEFTPEEEQALTEARRSGELAPVRRRKKSSSGGVRNGFSVVTVALLAGLAFLWGQEKFRVGYCNVGHGSREVAGVEIPEWADPIRPQCEPCPVHAALCEENFQTTCEPGFMLVPHPLSLGGKLPLPPTCEPDSAVARKVDAVKQKAVEELRAQNAEFECGKAPKPEIKETALKAKVSSQRRRGMTNEEFEALWESALPEIRKAEEVVEGTDGPSGEFTLRSHSLASIGLSCAVRRSLRQTFREYFWSLVIVLLTVGTGAYGKFRITSGKQTEAQAKQLARLALQKLSLQASLHAHDPSTYRENYIPMAQLRDDILRDEFSSLTRKKLWEKVQRKVEHNSNVRPNVREGRSGEVGRTWEWIGAIGMLEDSPDTTTQRRRSGHRVSFGGTKIIEPETDESGLEMSQVGKWEEGRQYY